MSYYHYMRRVKQNHWLDWVSFAGWVLAITLLLAGPGRSLTWLVMASDYLARLID